MEDKEGLGNEAEPSDSAAAGRGDDGPGGGDEPQRDRADDPPRGAGPRRRRREIPDAVVDIVWGALRLLTTLGERNDEDFHVDLSTVEAFVEKLIDALPF